MVRSFVHLDSESFMQFWAAYRVMMSCSRGFTSVSVGPLGTADYFICRDDYDKDLYIMDFPF